MYHKPDEQVPGGFELAAAGLDVAGRADMKRPIADPLARLGGRDAESGAAVEVALDIDGLGLV